MKKSSMLLALLLMVTLSTILSSCYVGYYGPRGRGYYNRGHHHHHYPRHYPHHYRGW